MRLLAIISWVGCWLDRDCKEKPSLRELGAELWCPSREPFS